jgi:hypothetical protein
MFGKTNPGLTFIMHIDSALPKLLPIQMDCGSGELGLMFNTFYVGGNRRVLNNNSFANLQFFLSMHDDSFLMVTITA